MSTAVTKMDPVYTVGYPAGQPWFPRVTPDIVAEATTETVAFETNYLQQGHSGGALVSRDWQIVGLIKQDQPPRGVAVRIGRVIERLTQWGYAVSLTTATAADSGGSDPRDAGRKRTDDTGDRGSPAVLSLRSRAEWPMFGYDSTHSHWNRAETTLRPPLKSVTRIQVPGMTIDSLSAGSGLLFAGGMNREQRNVVAALHPLSGKTMWSFALAGGGAMDVTPLYVDGTVYVGGQRDDHLYALDATTGKLKGKRPGIGSLYSKHPTATRQSVYVIASDSLLAIDIQSGTTNWSYRLPGGTWTQTSPVVAGPYVVALASDASGSKDRGTIHIFAAATGKLVRTFEVPRESKSITYPMAAWKSIVTASGGEVVSYSVESGSPLWRTQIAREAEGAALALGGASVFVRLWKQGPLGQGMLYALDERSGKVRWRFSTRAEGAMGPVVANGIVYITGWKRPGVFALDVESGKEVWSEDLPQSPTCDPIVAYGFLFVPLGEMIYVFG
jgi:outer membrane protein assembly factor BamB